MKNEEFRSHPLNQKEKAYGSVWLLFEALFFSAFLHLLNSLLPTPLPQTALNFVFFAVNFTVVAFLFREYLWKQIRLVPEVIGKVLMIAVIGFVAYWVVNFLLAQILLSLDPDFTSINDANIQQLAAEDYTLMFVGAVLLAPVAEECLFRGLVFRGMYERKPWLAWVLSITLFALVHILSYIGAYPIQTLLLCFVQYIPAGIVLAASYHLSGSLLAPILIHAVVNYIGMLSLR